MDINVVLVILIIGFSVITVFSLGALFAMRRRELNRKDSIIISRCIEDLDAASDSSLAEINKMGALVLKEIDEKHQALLFLYNLMEDKQKELTNEVWKNPDGHESLDGDVVSEMVAQYIEAHSAKLRYSEDDGSQVSDDEYFEHGDLDSDEVGDVSAPSTMYNKRPTFVNPKHKQVWEMHEQGVSTPDIAKELGIGQGEVRLILELAARAS